MLINKEGGGLKICNKNTIYYDKHNMDTMHNSTSSRRTNQQEEAIQAPTRALAIYRSGEYSISMCPHTCLRNHPELSSAWATIHTPIRGVEA